MLSILINSYSMLFLHIYTLDFFYQDQFWNDFTYWGVLFSENYHYAICLGTQKFFRFGPISIFTAVFFKNTDLSFIPDLNLEYFWWSVRFETLDFPPLLWNPDRTELQGTAVSFGMFPCSNSYHSAPPASFSRQHVRLELLTRCGFFVFEYQRLCLLHQILNADWRKVPKTVSIEMCLHSNLSSRTTHLKIVSRSELTVIYSQTDIR